MDEILHEMSRFLTTPLHASDILAIWCGIRPLVHQAVAFRNLPHQQKDAKDTASISRTHEIWSDGDGFVTISGGKWTTVRNMAEDLCDVIGRCTDLRVGLEQLTEAQVMPCRTKNYPYYGANERAEKAGATPPIRRYMQQQVEVQHDLEETYRLPSDIAEHLSHFYGYRAFQIAEMTLNEEMVRLHERVPYLRSEVAYCVREEMAVRLSDVIMRRLRIGVMDTQLALECLPACLDVMRRELHWNSSRCIDVEKGVMHHH